MSKLVIDLIGFVHGKTYGFEEYVFNLLKDFKKYRPSIMASEIIIACREDQVIHFNQILTEGFKLFHVKYKGKFGRLMQSERLSTKLKLTQDDLVLYPADFMPLRKNRTKTLLVVHDLLFMYGNLCERTPYFYLFRLQQALYEPQGIRKANKVIAISEFTKRDIVDKIHVRSDKIETIYNFFCFDKYKSNITKQIDNISYPYILSVCSGVWHKNHQILLEAFNELVKENDDIHLVIVGSLNEKAIPFYDSIKKEVKSRIHFYKHISNEDIAYLYINTKCFVSASLFEGLGMPVVEAMWFGVPVVLSDIEIHREVSFDKGIYFSSTSSHDLFIKEKGVLDGTITPQVVNKEIIEARYSSSSTSLKYIDEINKLLTAKN